MSSELKHEIWSTAVAVQSAAVWTIVASLVVASAAAQTAREVRGAAAVLPVRDEPPAKIVIDPPLAQGLARGVVVIQYRTENLHIAPVFGPAALAISPRVGHVHVSVDDAPWVWADASGAPVVVVGLTPGTHKIRMRLVTANHQKIDEGTVEFIVPETKAPAAALSVKQEGPAARIIIDSPLAEPLSRGVVYIPYRTENLRIVSVFGPAALAVTPRIGHIHVTVDDAPWHWADAGGNPVIVQGLAPGRHKILIELANANHEVVDQGTVEVTVPTAQSESAGSVVKRYRGGVQAH
jgi:hypothetical protein